MSVDDILEDRHEKYGPPQDHHTATAAVVTEIIRHKLRPGETFSARDWQRSIIGDKLIRDSWYEQEDNEDDIEGYARCMRETRLHFATSPNEEAKREEYPRYVKGV